MKIKGKQIKVIKIQKVHARSTILKNKANASAFCFFFFFFLVFLGRSPRLRDRNELVGKGWGKAIQELGEGLLDLMMLLK